MRGRAQAMDEIGERRMVGDTGYEVRQAFRIGGKEILLAENQRAADNMIYLVGQCTHNGFYEKYSQLVISDDYLESLRDFTRRIDAEATAIKAARDALGLPAELFTTKDCYPHSHSESIKGKVVAIKASVLNPEYRRGDVQLVYAVSGFGVEANSRGNAVFCYHLNNGKHTRFERYEVLGIVKELPEWAQESLARIQAEISKATKGQKRSDNTRHDDRAR
jgi:hypothetical protein